MSVEVFINFNGNCRKAVEFYAEVFGLCMPTCMTFGEAPGMQATDEEKDLVLYAELPIMGSNMMFSDCSPKRDFNAGNNISVTISSKDMNEVQTLFNKMKMGGEVEMALQETFWSKCFGTLVDKFGVHWQFSHDGTE